MRIISGVLALAITIAPPRPAAAQQRNVYRMILPLMVDAACYRHKGLSQDDITDFMQGALEVLHISPDEFSQTIKSENWKTNWATDGEEILVRKGGCEQVWQDWLNYDRAMDQHKPVLQEDDSSRPFSF